MIFSTSGLLVWIKRLSWITVGTVCLCAEPASIESNPADGKVPGYKAWVVPATPNGLVPRQAWLSVASTPAGDIYLAGSDHKTNSALYRLRAGEDQLRYVGDARAASEAVHNWLPGETAEKFHVRPSFYRGRVYVVTTDYSGADEGYLKRRGFHWYAFDEKSAKFFDLSAGEPKGIGGEHASLFALALDEKRGLLYGHDAPRGCLYCYNIATGQTRNLGRPPSRPDGIYMPGRYLWVNPAGRVYFTLSKCERIQYYDAVTGFGERPEVEISSKEYPNNVFRTGTRSIDGKHVYVSDREGWIWRYDMETDGFERLGQAVGEGQQYNSKKTLKMRAFNVTADERKIYFINDGAEDAAFWEWDIATKTTRRLCGLEQLDPRLGAKEYFNHCGNDTWDNNGCLYFCSFGSDTSATTRLILSRLDPVKLKVQLGVLSELVNVEIKTNKNQQIEIVRTGIKDRAQEVILKIRPVKGTNDLPTFIRRTIPAGEASFFLDLKPLRTDLNLQDVPIHVSVVSNGVDYRADGTPVKFEVD